MDVGEWLRSLGLERYQAAFDANEVDGDVLLTLTGDDLKDLGVTLVGHRRRMLDAIAALNAGEAPPLAQAADRQSDGPGPTQVGSSGNEGEAERRQLTVVFVDLVGSTELSHDLDPEEMRDIIRQYQNTVTGEITRFEGHIAKFMGDGVLAYFGWPRAHEDAAERAVRAGLAVTAAVGALTTQQGGGLAARVGIATGVVVVGDLVGEGAAQEEAVVGETPNLAARLQALALPDQVVIAEGTARLLGRLFDLRALEARAVKGFSEPVLAYQVLQESSAESRFEALHSSGLLPLVGREQEIALLLDRWRLAKSGEGQVVQLMGEPGIGKSRIVQALRNQVSAEPHLRLSYFCSPFHSNSAFYPCITQLSRAAGFERDDTAEQRLEKLEALLAQAADSLDEAVPVVASLLSVPFDDRYPPLNLSPQRQKTRLFEILLEQLDGLTARQPILEIVEDLHWMDPSSLELFDQVVDRAQGLPVLLVFTSRPDSAPRWLGCPHATLLTLKRLGRDDVADIVDRMTEGCGLPGPVLEHILARTDGVPLFVEELTKLVLESGLLRSVGKKYALCGPLPPLAIPATLQDSLMARLDRMAPVKEVAQIGAVIGRDFSYELLAAVANRPAAELQSALDQLVASELMVRRGALPDATYSFKHALVQDAAYESLLRRRRQVLHLQVVDAIEKQFPEIVQRQPELLARHCTEAGTTEKAIEYWKLAAQLAMDRSATKEAIAHLNAGLQNVKTLPESDADRHRRELELQLAIGSALVAAHGFAAPETEQAYVRARELCQKLNDRERLFPVLYGLCLFHLYSADLDAAQAASGQLLKLSEAINEPGPLFFAQRAAGVSSYPAGDFTAARGHLEEALSLYDPKKHRTPAFVYAFDPQVVCLDYLARTLLPLGLLDQAIERNEEAVAEARRIGHRNSLALPLFFGATLRQQCGDTRRVRTMADELAKLAEEEGFRFWLAGGNILQGWVVANEGDLQAGMKTMQDGIGEWQKTGANFMMPYFLALLADLHIRYGEPAKALSILDEAEKRIEGSKERWFEAEVHRTIGETLLTPDLRDERRAEACFERALLVARAQGARLWELRTVMSLGPLRSEQGRPDSFLDLLESVYSEFTEGHGTADLRRAKDALTLARQSADH